MTMTVIAACDECDIVRRVDEFVDEQPPAIGSKVEMTCPFCKEVENVPDGEVKATVIQVLPIPEGS
ncbi:MAG: hypothetical protein GTN93_10510 [Anaerolineae bacterium]|nr:hypothetical protein [Anaerolineae bacterium]